MSKLSLETAIIVLTDLLPANVNVVKQMIMPVVCGSLRPMRESPVESWYLASTCSNPGSLGIWGIQCQMGGCFVLSVTVPFYFQINFLKIFQINKSVKIALESIKELSCQQNHDRSISGTRPEPEA